METSAKTGMNAEEIFIEAARVLCKDYNEYKKEKKKKELIENSKILENTKNGNENKNKGCC